VEGKKFVGDLTRLMGVGQYGLVVGCQRTYVVWPRGWGWGGGRTRWNEQGENVD